MIKYGNITPDSKSDFDMTKKASFFDDTGFEIADEENKDKLKKPKKIMNEEDNQSI
jgi:hypothetical protein